MADGIEVVLGWPYREYAAVADLLKIKLPATEEDWEEVRSDGPDDWIRKNAKGLNKHVVRAQHDMLTQAGYTYVREVDRGGFIYKTPWGERDFRPMSFQLYYDWSEMGDKPEDTVVGVSISSRYRPVFLDADDPSGAIYHLVLDKETLHLIDLAKLCLTKHIPGFATAHTIVVQQHY